MWAQHIVTENIADFPSETLDEFQIEAINADKFLSRTFDLYPVEALEVLKNLRPITKTLLLQLPNLSLT